MTPAMQAMPKDRDFFHTLYMDLALALAGASHCIKKKVGAVIAKETRVISVGYNGPPAGTLNCDQLGGEGCQRSLRGGCAFAIHAEQNAILYALKDHRDLRGAVLYITLAPCLPCARLILSTGIESVYYRDSYALLKGLPEEEGINFLNYFGVQVRCYAPKPAPALLPADLAYNNSSAPLSPEKRSS